MKISSELLELSLDLLLFEIGINIRAAFSNSELSVPGGSTIQNIASYDRYGYGNVSFGVGRDIR